jgi:2-isopropylmalate synthase
MIKNPAQFEPDIESYLADPEQLVSREEEPIQLFDTTLRDGEQAEGAGMTLDQKILMATLSARTGIPVHEVGFAISGTDKQNVPVIAEALQDYDVEVASLSPLKEKAIDQTYEKLEKAGKKRIHTFLATSDIHLQKKFNGMIFPQAVDNIERVVGYTKRNYPDATLEFSPEDATRTDIKNLIIASRAAIAAGADVINVPDTVGRSNPFEVEYMFRQLDRNTEDLRADHDFMFSFHGHNDQNLGVANALAAIKGGARQVEGCWGDNGERAGNFALEEVVLALDMQGDRLHPDFKFRHDIAHRLVLPTVYAVYKIMGRSIPESKVLAGRRIALHGAGIHTDGSVKDGGLFGNESTYNVVDITKYGGKLPEASIGSRGGGADVVKALGEFGIEGLDKKSVTDITEVITKEAESCRRVYPAHALYIASQIREGLSDFEIEESDHWVRVSFDFDGQRHIFEKEIMEGNSAIQALVDGINDYCMHGIDIKVQSEAMQYANAEIADDWENMTGVNLQDSMKPIKRGSQAMAISRVTLANKDNEFNVHLAGTNVEETNKKAILVAAWPFLRERAITRMSLPPEAEERRHTIPPAPISLKTASN